MIKIIKEIRTRNIHISVTILFQSVCLVEQSSNLPILESTKQNDFKANGFYLKLRKLLLKPEATAIPYFPKQSVKSCVISSH